MADLTQARLKEVLNYDPETGVFTWRVRTSNRVKVGDVAGNPYPDGGLKCSIDCSDYFIHRLAWLYMTGEWPIDEIDHRNCNRSDNSWTNLRPANSTQNKRNARRRRDNLSGYKGVSSNHGYGWTAKIKIDGTQIYLGNYQTPEHAYEVYCSAARKYFGEFARFK